MSDTLKNGCAFGHYFLAVFWYILIYSKVCTFQHLLRQLLAASRILEYNGCLAILNHAFNRSYCVLTQTAKNKVITIGTDPGRNLDYATWWNFTTPLWLYFGDMTNGLRERKILIYDFDFGRWDVCRNIPSFTKCREPEVRFITKLVVRMGSILGRFA